MPKKVDHRERREAIARALWRVVAQQGWNHATMREVAREANASLGQVQHYFSTRTAMLTFAMEFAGEQASHRVAESLADVTHPREVLRVTLTEMLPLHPDARATSRMSAAYVLEALHDPELHAKLRDDLREKRALVEHLIRQAVADGHIAADRDPAVETNLFLALTGLTPLLELDVIDPHAALAAVDRHLDQLFA
ncbi:TetR family transcriptional regulator [Amycolatopsis rubida]|uniref:TetR family transcriptional regulator n=1 Tax=Amycolatopsis rubida TaxID=112413 RepID=A0A1I5WD89_9PSEU|nr:MULTISPECIES: TetR family transcriptional regulator C-terminal domain-containing protein [Amycolatopsis]MYW95227.1 TetR family transcriptional regulator [Amycolatopsis rubida]NEC60215.1 TetR family transcriptional regulator [Amycolatopsis rubida]OAP28376.1 HTH-type transcriptional regulator BetI [Amycolatopsis sp. M39]SFQ17724.1 transcriptional regulator, TetR family [Amycolatopsis rubida]